MLVAALCVNTYTTAGAATITQSLLVPQPDGADSTIIIPEPIEGFESADSFIVPYEMELTSISWWGSYSVDRPSLGDAFTLNIYGENVAQPNDVALASFTNLGVTATDSGELDPYGSTVYHYTTADPAGLLLQPGTYYLGLTNAVFENPTLNDPNESWFWAQGTGGDGVNWVRALMEPTSDPWVADASIDLSYSISGNYTVPLPGTALLLASALLILRRFIQSQ
jgi:hypothetical protein